MKSARKAIASAKPASRKAARLRLVPTPESPAAAPRPEAVASAALRAHTRAPPLEAMWWYQLALFQRSVLFLDTLRERANNMLAHEQAGLPPLLSFDYETILDARRFERPANYALLRITSYCGTMA
jgi:hypothetical protein